MGSPPTGNPRGRPTKYEARFCDLVVEDMAQGFTLSAFCGLIGVARSALNNWILEYPDFREAVTRGKLLQARSWEKRAQAIADGNGGPGAASIVQFGLKNLAPDEWRDRQEVEHSGKIGWEQIVAESMRIGKKSE